MQQSGKLIYDMTFFIQFRLKTAISSLCLMVVALTASGQYNVDSVRTVRRIKLERIANDPQAPLRAEDTAHVHYFEPDGSYRVRARVSLLHGEQPFRIPTSDGTSKPYVRYATAQFSLHGLEITLTVYQSADPLLLATYQDHLFLPFTDETNGNTTYGGGRYIDLSVRDIRDGWITIDFNSAYNPYCAYSSGYRCPVPPSENNLPIPIQAGEKQYTGPIRERPQPTTPVPTLRTDEQALIQAGDTSRALRILQDTTAADARILRKTSEDINPNEALLPLLAQRMFLAMTDTLRPGVGIAAPQVGINRNLIWVKRFDKPGEPFELYINPRITWRSALLRKGPEGCLSIPDFRGDVLRNYIIRVSYQDREGRQRDEVIEGFTAVIFQHETDHLLGILFTDRLAEQATKPYQPVDTQAGLYFSQPQH